MSGLRRLRAWAFGHELNPDNIRTQLEAGAVPVSYADCRTCADPCGDGHEEYPGRFTVDMETQMLGSVDSFRRQIFISTGAMDWDVEITWSRQSLAAHVTASLQRTAPIPSTTTADAKIPQIHGIFNASESGVVSVLNAHYKSIADDDDLQTVLVFPDFMIVSGVPSTREGARELWQKVLDPHIPRVLGSSAEESGFSTWVLPYSCVITFCSHKRRDKRCGISAPKLETAFTNALQARDWTVHNQLDYIDDPPLEKFKGTEEDKNAFVLERLKGLREEKTALILHNSHMGGHAYAGNCIIYTPNGASIWYGRVTPHEAESIVVETIEGGLLLPKLLRGGMGLSKSGCKTVHDW